MNPVPSTKKKLCNRPRDAVCESKSCQLLHNCVQQLLLHTFNGPLSGTTQVSWYQSGFYWSKRQWMAVASAEPYASLHLALDRQPRQHPTTQFFTGRMPFLPPNQQRQSTEGTYSRPTCNKIRASGHNASTVTGVIHKLDRRRVLLTTRSTCRGEIF